MCIMLSEMHGKHWETYVVSKYAVMDIYDLESFRVVGMIGQHSGGCFSGQHDDGFHALERRWLTFGGYPDEETFITFDIQLINYNNHFATILPTIEQQY